jgi:hypothetical protein
MIQSKDKNKIQVVLEADLVGIKNIKATHSWRIELDVYEMDSYKVKELFDLIDMPVSIGIVGKKKEI